MANGKDSSVFTGPPTQVPFPGTSQIVKAREGKWTGDCLSWGMGRRDHSGAIFLVGKGGSKWSKIRARLVSQSFVNTLKTTGPCSLNG